MESDDLVVELGTMESLERIENDDDEDHLHPQQDKSPLLESQPPPPAEPSSATTDPIKPSLSVKVLYGVPQLSCFFGNTILSQWITYYYLPPDGNPLVYPWLFGALLIAGRLLNAFADPPVGYYSDRCRSRLGRRIPFMLFGAPIMGLLFAMIWFPPHGYASTQNAIYFAVTFLCYNLFFAVVTAPYTALSPEVTVSQSDRVTVMTFSGLFSLFGNLLAAFVGPFQAHFRNGIDFAGMHFTNGLQLCGALAGFLYMTSFLIPLIVIRERSHHPAPSDTTLFKEIRHTFRNPAFRSLMGIASLLPMGITLVSGGLPYICTQILEREENQEGLVRPGKGEAWTGVIAGIMIGGALAWMPFVGMLVSRFGKKRIMLCSAIVMTVLVLTICFVPFFADPAVPMLLGVSILSLPAAVSFILPGAIYGDVVDYDEQHTGFRREGVYAGSLALINKSVMAFGAAITVYILALGNTRENPLGILLLYGLAAIVLGAGAALFSRHPIRT